VKTGVVVLLVAVATPALAQDTTLVQGGIYQRPYLVGNSRTAVGGYLEGNTNWFVTDGLSDGLSMELRRFNIFFYSAVGRRLRFTSELEFEHGTEEIALETALLDYTISPHLVVRGGILLPPIGAFNVNHDGPRYDVIERPLVSTEVLPATLSEVGLGIHGRFGRRATVFSYDAYLTNGLTDGVVNNGSGRTRLADGKTEDRFAEDNNGSPAVSVRLAAQSRNWGEIGWSIYTGAFNRYRVDGVVVDSKRSLTMMAVDLTTAVGGIEVRGEVATVSLDLPEALRESSGDRQWGGYLDVVAPVWRPRIRGLDRPEVSLVGRIERVDFNVGRFSSTDLPRGDEIDAVTVGVSFRPVPGTVFRANYRNTWTRDLQGNPRVRAAGWQLGIATYF